MSIQWNHVLEDVLGDDMGVNGARICHVSSRESLEIAVDGVFIAIGHVPNSDIFKGQLDMKNGCVGQYGARRHGNTNKYFRCICGR